MVAVITKIMMYPIKVGVCPNQSTRFAESRGCLLGRIPKPLRQAFASNLLQ